MHRYEAIELVLRLAGDRPIVGNLGPTSDELWHAGHRDRNFYTYGNMGLTSSLALGMALATDEQVISLDGDGSLLMNLGTLATIGREMPKNLVVLVYDNEAWGQTGNQMSHTGTGTSLEATALACGIKSSSTVNDLEELEGALATALGATAALHRGEDRGGGVPAHRARGAGVHAVPVPQHLCGGTAAAATALAGDWISPRVQLATGRPGL